MLSAGTSLLGMLKRLRESQVSAVLGIALVFFFIDGLLRDATVKAAIALVIIGVFIVLGLIRISDSTPVRPLRWQIVATTFAATILVGESVRLLGVSSVFAAATVGVVGGLLPRLAKKTDPQLSAAIYVGAFAGMTSPVILLGQQWLIVAGLVTGLLWSLACDAWTGIGGRFGTVAFIGVALTALLATVFGFSHGAPEIPTFTPTLTSVIVVISVASAYLTHWLAYRRNWGAVLGSSAPVVIAAIALFALRRVIDFPDDVIIAAWFGASFVGTTAPVRIHGKRWMLPTMAVTFAFLLVQFQVHLAGLGGDLGATASAAVIAVIGLQTAMSRLLRTNGSLELGGSESA